jgi:hypothetical protein
MQLPILSDEGRLQAILVIDEAVGIPALDAQAALADRVVSGWQDIDDFAIHHLEIDPAATATIDTGRQDVFVFHHPLPTPTL